MSSRAAWRLESLGFGDVYDYVDGKLDWMAAGLANSSATTDAPPVWARRMKRAQTVNQGVSAATHAVRSGDGAGGGASVDLSEGGQ